jgi:hypothetical protein
MLFSSTLVKPRLPPILPSTMFAHNALNTPGEETSMDTEQTGRGAGWARVESYQSCISCLEHCFLVYDQYTIYLLGWIGAQLSFVITSERIDWLNYMVRLEKRGQESIRGREYSNHQLESSSRMGLQFGTPAGWSSRPVLEWALVDELLNSERWGFPHESATPNPMLFQLWKKAFNAETKITEGESWLFDQDISASTDYTLSLEFYRSGGAVAV